MKKGRREFTVSSTNNGVDDDGWKKGKGFYDSTIVFIVRFTGLVGTSMERDDQGSDPYQIVTDHRFTFIRHQCIILFVVSEQVISFFKKRQKHIALDCECQNKKHHDGSEEDSLEDAVVSSPSTDEH